MYYSVLLKGYITLINSSSISVPLYAHQVMRSHGTLKSHDTTFMTIYLDEGLNYVAILETAIDVAQGMFHLHIHNIIHADLKV